MRTVVIALASTMVLASIAMPTAPAYAQMRGKGGGKHPEAEQQSAEQKRKAAEAEKAYKAALEKIRPVGEYALGPGFGSTRPARRPHSTHDRDDLFAAASNRAMGKRAPAFVRGEVVVGDRRARRPLIRRPMNPERGGEAMQIIRVLGEQVGPSEAPPFPDRIVDVNGASARRRAAATNVSACLPHRSISSPAG